LKNNKVKSFFKIKIQFVDFKILIPNSRCLNNVPVLGNFLFFDILEKQEVDNSKNKVAKCNKISLI